MHLKTLLLTFIALSMCAFPLSAFAHHHNGGQVVIVQEQPEVYVEETAPEDSPYVVIYDTYLQDQTHVNYWANGTGGCYWADDDGNIIPLTGNVVEYEYVVIGGHRKFALKTGRYYNNGVRQGNFPNVQNKNVSSRGVKSERTYLKTHGNASPDLRGKPQRSNRTAQASQNARPAQRQLTQVRQSQVPQQRMPQRLQQPAQQRVANSNDPNANKKKTQ